MIGLRVTYDFNLATFKIWSGGDSKPIDAATASAIAQLQLVEQVEQINKAVGLMARAVPDPQKDWRRG